MNLVKGGKSAAYIARNKMATERAWFDIARLNGSYFTPDPAELVTFGSMVAALAAGGVPADVTADAASLHLLVTESDGVVTIREDPGGPGDHIYQRGRGFFLLRRNQRPDFLMMPHQDTDSGTRSIGWDLFIEGSFSAACWNTRSRTFGDMAHLEGTYWQTFVLAVAAQWPDGQAFQIHGFSHGNRATQTAMAADQILSDGTDSPNDNLVRLWGRLRSAFGRNIELYGVTVTELGATTNTQAPALRAQGYNNFIHIENSRPMREMLENKPHARQRLLKCMQYDYTVEELGNDLGEVQVTHRNGAVAIFTPGAKKVTIEGLGERTFTQQKRAFTDNHGRVTVDSWGTSPEGGTCIETQGVPSDFSCDGTYGRIHCSTTNESRYCTYGDNNVKAIDYQFPVAIDTAPAGNANSNSGLLYYQFPTGGPSNHYRCRLQVNSSGAKRVQAFIDKNVGGTVTTIAGPVTLAATYVSGERWFIRPVGDGTGNLSMYAWKEGTAAPVTPTLSAVDSTFVVGRIGHRVFASTGSTNNPTFIFGDLVVNSCEWANPPVVTHDTWVRLLDDPFSEWNDDIETQLSYWLTDTSDDILAVSMQYITGAPDVYDTDPTSPTYGLLIAGQNQYGPLDVDGKRFELSDFNDFMGVPWDFVNGEHRPFPHGNITIPRCMDCSGSARMAWGFRQRKSDGSMKIPLIYSRTADFNGINLMKASKNQALFGPGVTVDSTYVEGELAIGPIDWTKLRIGDIVYFDKDQSGLEETGQFDHIGWVIGFDVNTGLLLFISSRKTVNGLTFSEMGGSSGLNNPSGSNYANRCNRAVRF